MSNKLSGVFLGCFTVDDCIALFALPTQIPALWRSESQEKNNSFIKCGLTRWSSAVQTAFI